MGKHDHSDGCGCGHDHELEHDSITLTLEDGTEINCSILSIFSVDNKDYIALQPEEGEEDEDNIYLYRFMQDDDGEPQLLNIEDDEEFEAVADAFEEILDEQDFDELFDEDDYDFEDGEEDE